MHGRSCLKLPCIRTDEDISAECRQVRYLAMRAADAKYDVEWKLGKLNVHVGVSLPAVTTQECGQCMTFRDR